MPDQQSSHSSDNSRTRFRFFPRNWNDGSLIYVCLILSSITGIMIIGLKLHKSHQAQKQESIEAETHKDWVESLVPTQADLIDSLLQDVTTKRTLVIFENGSIVIVPEPNNDPQKTAIETLSKNASPDSIFAVNRVDKDYAIRYKGPLFTRISGAAVAAELKRIRKNWKQFLTPSELKKAEQDNQDPDLSTQVGLIARSFLARDLEALKVTKILKAKSK